MSRHQCDPELGMCAKRYEPFLRQALDPNTDPRILNESPLDSYIEQAGGHARLETSSSPDSTYGRLTCAVCTSCVEVTLTLTGQQG